MGQRNYNYLPGTPARNKEQEKKRSAYILEFDQKRQIVVREREETKEEEPQ